MEIKSINIRNFKKFENTYIEFQPGFNLIIGESGVGKTSVLEAIASGLSGYIAGMNGVTSRNIRSYEIRQDLSSSHEQHVPVQINIDAIVNGDPLSWTRERRYLTSARSATVPREIAEIAYDRSFNNTVALPILSYYTSRRFWYCRSFSPDEHFHYDREDAYESSLLESASMKSLLRYFEYMEHVNASTDTPILEYECVKETIITFINQLYDRNIYDIVYNPWSTSLSLLEGNNEIDVSMLNEEELSSIGLVADIVSRMAILNPFLIDEINRTTGVVLIDELELHVSIKNQWKLINLLCRTFPNVQFIVTTNSPVLLASADVHVIKLYDHDIEYYRSHYGVDVNTAIRQYFGDYEFSQPIRNEIENFFSYMDKEDYENARNLLDRLKITTAPEFPTIVEMEELYDLETADLV